MQLPEQREFVYIELKCTLCPLSCTSVHQVKFKVTIKQRKIGIFTAVDKRLVAQEYSKFHLRAMLVMHQIRSHIQRVNTLSVNTHI